MAVPGRTDPSADFNTNQVCWDSSRGDFPVSAGPGWSCPAHAARPLPCSPPRPQGTKGQLQPRAGLRPHPMLSVPFFRSRTVRTPSAKYPEMLKGNKQEEKKPHFKIFPFLHDAL